jgi:hypothetical protein
MSSTHSRREHLAPTIRADVLWPSLCIGFLLMTVLASKLLAIIE